MDGLAPGALVEVPDHDDAGARQLGQLPQRPQGPAHLRVAVRVDVLGQVLRQRVDDHQSGVVEVDGLVERAAPVGVVRQRELPPRRPTLLVDVVDPIEELHRGQVGPSRHEAGDHGVALVVLLPDEEHGPAQGGVAVRLVRHRPGLRWRGRRCRR